MAASQALNPPVRVATAATWSAGYLNGVEPLQRCLEPFAEKSLGWWFGDCAVSVDQVLLDLEIGLWLGQHLHIQASNTTLPAPWSAPIRRARAVTGRANQSIVPHGAASKPATKPAAISW
jgi:hypothetical protein